MKVSYEDADNNNYYYDGNLKKLKLRESPYLSSQ